MKVQLPPTLVVQAPDHGDNFPPAPYFEFTMELMLRIPEEEVHFYKNKRFAVRMVQWPLQQIAYHSQWIKDPPAWSSLSRILHYGPMGGDWNRFAGTWEIKMREPLWIAPMALPLPQIDFAERPYVEVIDLDTWKSMGEWFEYARLIPELPGGRVLPDEYFSLQGDEVIDRAIRYWRQPGNLVTDDPAH